MIRVILNGTAYPENYFSWQERKEVIARSEMFHGVITTTNLDLQFIGDACAMLMALDSEFDVAAVCTIDIQTFDQIEGWKTEWSGYLDFKTFKVSTTDGLKCTVSAYDTGFSNKLLERMEIEIPYDRLETLDGATITPFTNEYQTVDILGIDIVATNQVILTEYIPNSGYISPPFHHSSQLNNFITTSLYPGDPVGSLSGYIAPDQDWVNNRMFFQGNGSTGNIRGTFKLKWRTNELQSAFNAITLLDYRNESLTPNIIYSQSGIVSNGEYTHEFDLDYDFNNTAVS